MYQQPLSSLANIAEPVESVPVASRSRYRVKGSANRPVTISVTGVFSGERGAGAGSTVLEAGFAVASYLKHFDYYAKHPQKVKQYKTHGMLPSRRAEAPRCQGASQVPELVVTGLALCPVRLQGRAGLFGKRCEHCLRTVQLFGKLIFQHVP